MSIERKFNNSLDVEMVTPHHKNYLMKNLTTHVKSSMELPQETPKNDQFVSQIYGQSSLQQFTTFQKLFGEWDLSNHEENLKQWKQFIFSIILLALGTYFGSMFGVINEAREIKGYANIRNVNPNFRLVDTFALISTLKVPWLPGAFLAHICLIITLRFVVFCGPYSMRATILRRFFAIMGVLYFSRGICLLSTTLPRSDTSYPEPSYNINDSVFYNGLLVTLQISKNAGDMCFSGHAMIAVLCMLFYFEYCKQCPILLLSTRMYTDVTVDAVWTAFLTMYVFFGVVICIICTRFHYSLDCFVAFVFTYFLYQWYYVKIRSCMFEKNPTYFVSFLQWFEQHAEDLQVERKKIRELQDIVEKYQYLQKLRIQSLVRNSPNSRNRYETMSDNTEEGIEITTPN